MPPWAIAHTASQLRHEIDWQALLREAHRHAVLLLLRHNLQRHFWPQIPAEVREYLTQAAQHAQRRNLALTAELLKILRTLRGAGVPAIPFKGPVLAAAAYGNAALRTFGDLDILVHEQDLTAAGEALVAQGYVPKFTFTSQQERAYRKAECALQFRHATRDVVVELHWSLTERYLSINLPIDDFWNRAIAVKVSGHPAVTFAPEDLFLYLCVHGSKHEWERLEWLSSVAAVMEAQPEMNWEAVAARAQECGIRRLVKVAVLLANRLLHVPLPLPFRNEAESDHGVDTLFREVMLKIFAPGLPENDAHKRGNWYLFLLRTRERWADKTRIILRSSLRLPHPNAERYMLPPQLTYLHYVVRPLRLLRASVALTWHYWTAERRRLTAPQLERESGHGRDSADAHLFTH